MKEKFFIQTMSITVLTILLLFHEAGHTTENIDPLDDDSQYAYGENMGWLNAEPGGNDGDGVQVDIELTGYIWAENIGWISLSCANTSSCGTVDFQVEHSGGTLVGHAWGENVGWINFNPTYGGVSIDGNGDFNGWAWGENIGWIHFKSESPVAYKVQTSWTPTAIPTLSEWGMIIFMIVVIGTGVIILRKRRMV